MKTLRQIHLILLQLLVLTGFALMSQPSFGQAQSINGANSSSTPGRPVTIPVIDQSKREDRNTGRITEHRSDHQ